MANLVLEGRMDTTLDIDVCAGCRVIWFDRFEDLRLAPASTLKLFGVIGESSETAAAPLPRVLRCPRCRAQLLLTHDLQGSTRFQYWRCDASHGRLITFIDFLREKEFVRPLTPQQLDELRQNVQTINCSNCGAAVDLAKDSVCAHCGSAVSMLDLKQMARTIGQLQSATLGGQRDDPGVSVQSSHDDLKGLMLALKAGAQADAPRGLIETGLSLMGELLNLKRRLK
jgi:DNA-directed RNA polymerase subunit RPC12/RpoP